MDLVVEPGGGFELERAGAGAADDVAAEALLAELLDGAADAVGGRADGGAALLGGAEMLGSAVIGLQPGEAEVLRGGDLLGEG